MFVDQMREFIPENPKPGVSIKLTMKSPARRWAPPMALMILEGIIDCPAHCISHLWKMAEESRNEQPDQAKTYEIEVKPAVRWNADQFTLAIAEQTIRVIRDTEG